MKMKGGRAGNAPEQFTAAGYPKELQDQGAPAAKKKTKKRSKGK